MRQTLFEGNILKGFISQFKKNLSNKRNKGIFIGLIILIIFTIISISFLSSNENNYSKTIAKITYITEKEDSKPGMNGSIEPIKNQQIKAIIMNGSEKGKEIQLSNTTSYSQAYDLNLKVNDEIFVSIQVDNNKNIISTTMVNFKRDNYLFYIAIIFIFLIVLIGGLKGFKSLTSVVINIIIFYSLVIMFLKGYNFILIAIAASILFIVVSISLVSGINKKTISAIVGTVAGTLISMLITAIVIQLTHSKGIHYEEMEFLTHPPEKIFYVEILIGTLGAIMDIAISISSAIKEIYDKNPNIEIKFLINSSMEIGKDIMGTMANTLVFAYISGSIPIILLMLRNGFPISSIVGINMSLEIIRALTGSIGIVLSIPITMFTAIILLKNHKIGGYE